jgi:hypothetical protein
VEPRADGLEGAALQCCLGVVSCMPTVLREVRMLMMRLSFTCDRCCCPFARCSQTPTRTIPSCQRSRTCARCFLLPVLLAWGAFAPAERLAECHGRSACSACKRNILTDGEP